MKHQKINMMEFLGKKAEQNKKKVGTPTKKIKLNEENEQFDSDWQNPFGNLLFIKNISKTESPIMTQKKPQGSVHISEFSLGVNPEFANQNKQNDQFIINKPSQEPMDEQKQFKLPSKINKRTNSVDNQCPNQEFDHFLIDLNLTKHNSTFPVVNFKGLQNQDELGDNIYLNQLLTLKAKISLTDANNENRQILRNIRNNQSRHQQNRLEQDYEIKQNLGKYQPNKEGFICLNKLQKIFYYVKKISLSRTPHNLSLNPLPSSQYSLQKFLSNLSNSKRQDLTLTQTALICQQIKLYNRDSDTHLVRFYQEWIENNSLFMIYELGSYSLADKIESGQKLPESQVWSIIYNCMQSLKWIYENDKVHMNIKPGNIIKSRGKYKLADPLVNIDFLQSHLQQTLTINQQFYIPPELKEFQSFLEGIDFGKCEVYSLGMAILENISMMPRSMKGCNPLEVKVYFKKQIHGYSSYLRRLLFKMIDTNYKKRPTFQDLLCSNIEENTFSRVKMSNEAKFKRSNSL